MCGIVGLWNVASQRPQAVVGAMLDAMKHRGPDGRGTMEYAGGAAGMVRLALVDLSDRGQQPIWSADGRAAILFNGEIYNFRSERDRLEKAGYRFHTTTDTEVVLNLYLKYGLDFHERLRGMYALAIFNWRQTSEQGLPVMVLARDPLGIKHLYVTNPGGDSRQVVFSSEIRGFAGIRIGAARGKPRGAVDVFELRLRASARHVDRRRAHARAGDDRTLCARGADDTQAVLAHAAIRPASRIAERGRRPAEGRAQ